MSTTINLAHWTLGLNSFFFSMIVKHFIHRFDATTILKVAPLTYVSKFKHIRDGQQSLMIFGVFRSQHGTKGKALSRMGIMRDGDQVGI